MKKRGRRAVIRDHGAGGTKNGRLVSMKACITLRCESCNHVQFESKSRMHRRAIPKCDRCGGYMEYAPKGEAEMLPKKKKKDSEPRRRCESCDCLLRRGSKRTLCLPCTRAKLEEKWS